MMRQAEHRKAIKNATSLGRHLLAAIAVVLLTTVGAANANDAAVCRDAAQKTQWTRALPACTAAAKKGDVFGQTSVGVMYLNGNGIVQNYEEALRYLSLAAEQGRAGAYAQYLIGEIYRLGLGIKQDQVRAHMYYNLAASSGVKDAAMHRDLLADDMTNRQITRAQAMAKNCVVKNYKAC